MFQSGCEKSGARVARTTSQMSCVSAISRRIAQFFNQVWKIDCDSVFTLYWGSLLLVLTYPHTSIHVCTYVPSSFIWLALQDEFISTMHTIVTKKQSYKVKKEEGWYSESEMLSDLGWSQWGPQQLELHIPVISQPCSKQYPTKLAQSRSKVDGAKTRCLSMGESHVRPSYFWSCYMSHTHM